ncbi:MAG TPA: cystathionine gamma-synthase family protein [Acidimicrobiia bacterium]
MTGLGTLSVWAGEDGPWPGGSTQVPVVHSVAFGHPDLDDWQAVARGDKAGYIYSRNTNPTVNAFEQKAGALEGGESATSFASGMAAISCTLHALLRPGNRVISIKDTYGGTNRLFTEFLPAIGIDVTLVETADDGLLESTVRSGCDLVYLETPTNPTLKVLDIERLSRAGREVGAVVVVDNTVATPINQRPLSLGVDLVVHSATKFLGGHADALGGVVVGTDDLVRRVFAYREINGAALNPMAAYLLLRGMKTLHLRVERQSSNAQIIATHLENDPRISVVNYPGLPSHPFHQIARKQMSGFGGLLSFGLTDGADAVARFIANLDHAHAAANLGAVETTVGPPATTSHVEVSAEAREALGIPEGLIRYSAGIEDIEDLLDAIDGALAAI